MNYEVYSSRVKINIKTNAYELGFLNLFYILL